MKPVILISNWKLMGKRTIGVALFPFILLRKSYFDKRPSSILKATINHEKIHIQQQSELLVIFFYLWYALEFCIKSFKYGTSAYEHISFEKEAYANENNLEYLETRKFWAFIQYVVK